MATLDNCGGQSEVVSGSLFIRKVRLFTRGDQVGDHAHNFDHTTFFMKGRVLVHRAFPDGHQDEQVCQAGDYLLVEKDVIHRLTALDDDALFMCVYVHRNAAGQLVETFESLLATQ